VTIKSLALDGSGPLGGVALLEEEHVVASTTFAEGPGFGVALFAQVAEILAQNHLVVANLNLLTVALGPGSFTGLRFALGLAKGMAMVHDIPVVGVSTLALAAADVRENNGWILPIRDAGNHFVFYALYQSIHKKITPIFPPTMGRMDTLTTMLKTATGSEAVLCCGSGLKVVGDQLQELLRERFVVHENPFSQPSAGLLGRLGLETWRNNGKLPSPMDLEPLYLRPPQAEWNRREQIG